MKKGPLKQNKVVYYFDDPQFCRLPWNTTCQLWSVIEKAPFKKGKEERAGLLELPELMQLELASILIRRDYLSLRLAEERPGFVIALELNNAKGI